ncbi:metallophosphoesterase [Algoriphagus lutimaris]|uniref:metallophosphoesterase family protein n=1 Tax=Algoriphagus lutimaris TaxID=613197 RepID=UPI00196B2EC7|nr:metallophosphoesterase [Algoriphagus lutimaris]MBN3522058.1 metallophosphoesterase [Algoriphagus lutimaris]
MKLKLRSLPLLLFALACSSPPEIKPQFEHDISSGPTPWTSDSFELEEEDFTFAIISDLTGGERPNIYGTAVGQLNRLDPTFVLSVGDLIEGGTEDTLQLQKERDSFDGRTSNLNMPFFHLGGNHDLTNPVMRKFWENRFGRRYYHFVYENVLFLMLDSEDYEEQRMIEIYEARAKALQIINGEIEGVYEESDYYKMSERSLGGMSNDQFEYHKAVLEKYPDVKWTFLLMHKPLWMHEDDKGLERLEALLVDRPYTVFNGHFHSYSHRKRLGRDYIMLGTTGGSQNPRDSMAFDEVTLVRMDKEPVITTLKMEGILDETGKVAVVYDSLNRERKDF